MRNPFVQAIQLGRNFMLKGHARSVNAKKNILASVFIKGAGILISLLLVPLTIHYVSPVRYGIWITLSSFIGWFGFFDIGFGNGLRNRFADALARGQFELARIYVSTTYAILSIIIGILLVLFLIVNPFLNWARILNTPPEMAKEVSVLAMLVFVFFCIQFVLQLITTVITADQKPAKASLFNLFGSVFSLVTIFILTRTTKGSLLHLGLSLGVAPVIVLLLSTIWFYTHEYKRFAPSLKFVKFRYAKDLMTLGVKFFFIQIAAIILFETSNMVITQLFGPSQVTSYNIAYKYFGIIPMAFSIVLAPLWSAYTEAYAKHDINWITSSMKNIRIVWAIFSVCVLLMLLAAPVVYRFWVGSSIEIPFLLSASLALYVVINSWCSIYSQFLNGVGKIKLQLYSALFGAVVNIPMSVFLCRQIGISGVVISTCILGLMAAVWSPIQYHKIVNNTATGIWNK